MSDPSEPRYGTMYLVLPVPMRSVGDAHLLELQAANGIDRWADNFDNVIIAAPVLPEEMADSLPGFVWHEAAALENIKRVEFQPLPWAYTPGSFLKHLGTVRKQVRQAIERSSHLQFAIGGLIGDWAAIAAREAIRLKRPYAIHTDRVEHEVVRKTSAGASPLRRLRAMVEVPLMQRYHRYLIQHCSLGLWHGDDCFRAYSPWCAESHLIHDVHTKASDAIAQEELDRKLASALSETTLHLCYAGRFDPMKAPLEWLRAIAAARGAGASVTATWYGEGTLLESAKAERTRLGLDGFVHFPGFVSSRARLLANLRSAHAMVFTHITPESPRNLIESLVSGSPILGYANSYADNLVEGTGGGLFVPIHDTEALGRLIAELAVDRQRLARLIRDAARTGRQFNDASVFAERSNLIRKYA